MRDIDKEMSEVLKKFGFDKFFRANNAAFMGVLADINKKFGSCSKDEKKKLMQYYTNLGISCFSRK